MTSISKKSYNNNDDDDGAELATHKKRYIYLQKNDNKLLTN